MIATVNGGVPNSNEDDVDFPNGRAEDAADHHPLGNVEIAP